MFDCVRSELVLGSTLEALPQAMDAPRVLPLDPYQISVMWQTPDQPNGIILRYDLWRRTIQQCSEMWVLFKHTFLCVFPDLYIHKRMFSCLIY